jgi:cyclase
MQIIKTILLGLTVGLAHHLALGSQNDIDITEITPNVLVFATGSGNVVTSVGQDGALLVGTPSVASTSEISRVLAKRTRSSFRYVVIAPHAPDRSQGDAGWGRRGAFVAMQENALQRLGGHTMGATAALPKRLIDLGVDRPRVAFSEVLTFDINGEGVHIVRQGPAYSDADALVHFHVANLLYFGEVFPGDGYPEIDGKQGGSLDGFVKILSSWTDDKFHIVPAHGKVVSGSDVKDFCAMLTAVREHVQRLVDSGQTEDQVLRSNPTAEFDGRWGHGRIGPKAFVREIYASVKTEKHR